MNLHKHDNRILIKFAYNPALVSQVKQLDRRVYHPRERCWSIPIEQSEQSLRLLSRLGFMMDEELQVAVEEDKAKQARMSKLASLTDTTFESSLPLFPYQRVGARFLLEAGSALLGDEPGLGKTLQTLAVCEASGAERVLIVCPSALKYQWQSEILRFLKLNAIVIDGSKKEREKQWSEAQHARYVIMNYELLLRDDYYEAEPYHWDYILADEAQKIGNPKSKTSKAIRKLPSRHRIAMSGTFISNNPTEIWSAMDFCNPGSLGKYWDFQQRYIIKNHFGGAVGYQHLDELSEKISRHIIRRKKVDVLPELPEKIVSDVPFKLSAKERKLYKQLKEEVLFEIEKELLDKVENPASMQFTLVKMTRLAQLADSMELLGQGTKSSKLEVLDEILTEQLQAGRKVIVFSRFKEMCKIMQRHYKDYQALMIIGDTPTRDRQGIVKEFNESEDKNLLIMSEAGGAGLNLQSCETIVHYDLPWSIAKKEQREGRAHRIGQTKVVNIFSLLARGTLDIYVRRVLHGKQEISAQLLRDKPTSMDMVKEILDYDG